MLIFLVLVALFVLTVIVKGAVKACTNVIKN